MLTLAIHSDSELLVKQMKGLYKVKNPALAQLKAVAVDLLKPYTFTFTHVMREKNKDADALANLGVDKKYKVPTGFAKILSNYEIFL